MDNSTASILAFEQVSKQFDGQLALDDISLSLEPGMVVGLLGQNGAGKSTLMRCALGIVNVDAGRVEVLGQSSQNLSSAQKERIGYVPQQPFGYEGFTVAKALDLHRSFYPNWDEALEQTWLERFELDGSKQVQRLSVGQRQSLALIMAMAYRPQLLILDEPVASLDPIARRKFMADLFDLALDSGSAVLFSSHITSDLERVASHLALLKQGKLVLFKEIDKLREQVQLVTLKAETELPPSLTILNRQQDKLLVDNYHPDMADYFVAVTPVNLEQLFMELHR
ncbi:ABC transporter ATP-binding protein [Shewanella sp. Isolate11]|uniref:ABC transporter ATP-binding protein n=1 Tax=Shewanella sp. Isolate11 TaxID=2908530 RepID=UPI001EFEBC06|nr:ABC transporter ATP-binding protein [Shewanella sp. Isolate11]MCG9698414.1 ABC transporter ATP-binding protein [Shewanella sp. Isolate11]